MKQIILHQNATPSMAPACSGRLFLVWGLFGLSLAFLGRLAGPSEWTEGSIWGVGLIAGLLLALREV